MLLFKNTCIPDDPYNHLVNWVWNVVDKKTHVEAFKFNMYFLIFEFMNKLGLKNKLQKWKRVCFLLILCKGYLQFDFMVMKGRKSFFKLYDLRLFITGTSSYVILYQPLHIDVTGVEQVATTTAMVMWSDTMFDWSTSSTCDDRNMHNSGKVSTLTCSLIFTDIFMQSLLHVLLGFLDRLCYLLSLQYWC